MKPFLTHNNSNNAHGFSVLELLIVIAMGSVIVGFALMQIFRVRQNMTRANAAQLFTSHLEKARLDSLRRHPATSAQMAQIQIVNATFYTLAVDTDGNSTLDAPVVVSLPAGSGLQFNTPFPRTIYFNWRGRSVDAAGNPATPPFVTISNSYGTTRIDLTSSGQPSLDGPPPVSPVVNSAPPAAAYRNNTQLP